MKQTYQVIAGDCKSSADLLLGSPFKYRSFKVETIHNRDLTISVNNTRFIYFLLIKGEPNHSSSPLYVPHPLAYQQWRPKTLCDSYPGCRRRPRFWRLSVNYDCGFYKIIAYLDSSISITRPPANSALSLPCKWNFRSRNIVGTRRREEKHSRSRVTHTSIIRA